MRRGVKHKPMLRFMGYVYFQDLDLNNIPKNIGKLLNPDPRLFILKDLSEKSIIDALYESYFQYSPKDVTVLKITDEYIYYLSGEIKDIICERYEIL